MDSISPNIFVKDINETIKYYKLLGFEVAMTVPEQGDAIWAMMTCGKIKADVKVIKGLEKTFYGATEFSIQDINGYLLTFAEDEE